MYSTEISPEFECQGERGQMSSSPGTKNDSAAFCSGVVLCGAVLVRHFFRQPSPGRFYAGGKISACCLV